jgi:hypothetical protein
MRAETGECPNRSRLAALKTRRRDVRFGDSISVGLLAAVGRLSPAGCVSQVRVRYLFEAGGTFSLW